MISKLFILTISVMITCSHVKSQTKVDLRISDDETYKRPNAWSKNDAKPPGSSELLYSEASVPSSRPGVSIAWRNANQVEEVEVRVQNLGEEPGEGKLYVQVLDESGKTLLYLEPPDELKTIRIPAYSRGGKEGKIIRMKASWELNALIDRFDRTRTRFGVRATIETNGPDKNWLDNSKIKEWNMPFKVQPTFLNVYNYIYKNNTEKKVTVKWFLENSTLPKGWILENVPAQNKKFILNPGEEITGSLLMRAPQKIDEGSFLEARLSLVDVESNRIFQQHEWFQVYDTEKPLVSNYKVVLLNDNTMAIQALVADKGSGVLEATGVSTEFSVDGGKTWAAKAHNYKVGNFVRPTLFETVIGPFTSGTNVLIRFTALDTYGNSQTIIPNDASAFSAPKTAELLLQQSYIFPRTQQNPLFDLEKLKNLNVKLETLKNTNINIASLDLTKENPLGIDAKRLSTLGLDLQRLNDIKQDLMKISELNFDINEIKPVEIKRVKSLGQDILNITTLEFKIK